MRTQFLFIRDSLFQKQSGSFLHSTKIHSFDSFQYSRTADIFPDALSKVLIQLQDFIKRGSTVVTCSSAVSAVFLYPVMSAESAD